MLLINSGHNNNPVSMNKFYGLSQHNKRFIIFPIKKNNYFILEGCLILASETTNSIHLHPKTLNKIMKYNHMFATPLNNYITFMFLTIALLT